MPKSRQSNRRRHEPSTEESIPANDKGTPVLRAEDIEGFVSLEERAVRVLALITQLFGSHNVSTNYGDGRGENSNTTSLPLEGDHDASVVVEAEHVSSDSTTIKDDNEECHLHEPEDQVKENLDNCDTLSLGNPSVVTDPAESTTIDRSDLCEKIPRHSPILPHLAPAPAPAPATTQKRTRGFSKPKGFVAKKESKQSAPPRLPLSLAAAAAAAAAAVTATAASSPPSSANPNPTSPATSTPSLDPNAESLPAPCPAPTTKRKGRPGRLRVSKARRR